MMDLSELLLELQERNAFKASLLSKLQAAYQLTGKDLPANQYATAGHVFSYLAKELGLENSSTFRIKARNLLVGEGLIKPCRSCGKMWLKGVVAKDPTADLLVREQYSWQRRKDVQACRARNRQHA